MNAFSQAVFLPCGSTMKQRWRRSDRSGPTPRQRPCSAQQCSSRCSLTCQRRRELRSCCTEKWQLNGRKKTPKQNKKHQPELKSHRDQLWASDINTRGSNWPPKSGQHQELSLRAPEDAVGLLLVKHLCRKKQKPALQCVSEAFQKIPRVFFPYLWARSFRCFWRDRRRRWSWETLREERQTCCRWVPTQTLWCFLEWEQLKIRLLSLAGIQSFVYFSTVLTLHLDHIHRNLLLPHTEDFKVGDHTLKWICEWLNTPSHYWHWCLDSFTPLAYLCSLWSPVHFDAQVVSVPLPVQFAVDDVEEVPDADLLTGGHLHQSHSGRDVFVLWYPERYDVVTRRPGEVPEETG